MAAHLTVPAGVGPWPGALVIHDALGMTSDVLRQTRWLAEAGFLALAPDLYHWGGRIRCLVAAMRSITERQGRTFEDLAAARTWLATRPDCTGAIGVVGFCLGGGFALVLSTMPGYGASSVNYGPILDDADVLADACPIVASYGGRDRSLADTPARLVEVLREHAVPHDVQVYPRAGHGFMNVHPGRENPLWARVAGTYARTGHDPIAEADARHRIAAFLHEHLAAE